MRNPFTLSDEQLDRLNELHEKQFSNKITKKESRERNDLIDQNMRGILIDDFIKVSERANIKPTDLTREQWRAYSTKYESDVGRVFGSFGKMKKEFLSLAEDPYAHAHERSGKAAKKTELYVVTSAVAGQSLNHDFWETLKHYCKVNSAKLIVLPVRPVYKKEDYFPSLIGEQADFFGGNYDFNSNLVAKDFQLYPQQMIPTTGLGRYGQKGASLIIASPKVFMEVKPVGNTKHPHMIHSTGVVTNPDNYASTRAGSMAAQDHKMAALVVETSGSFFNIRQLTWNEKKQGFYDVNKFYTKDSVKPYKVRGFVMGDLHAGHHNPAVLSQWVDVINRTGAEFVFLHDAFDGTSISHHADGDFYQLCRHRPEHLNTLEKELKHFCQVLGQLNSDIGKSRLVMVPSNHPEWVQRYLRAAKYAFDPFNHLLALELAQAYIGQDMDPIQYFVEKNCPELKDQITWLRRQDDFYIGNRQHAAHGDKSFKGMRGTIQRIESAYGCAIIGHGHSPRLFRDVAMVGTTTFLQAHYMNGEPSDWLNTSGLTDEDGIVQLISVINGKWTFFPKMFS